MEWRDDGYAGQDRGENFSTAAAPQESMTLSRLGPTHTSAIITAEKKHGKFGREADHHRVLCHAMCKYEIILLKMSHHFTFIHQAHPTSAFHSAL